MTGWMVSPRLSETAYNKSNNQMVSDIMYTSKKKTDHNAHMLLSSNTR